MFEDYTEDGNCMMTNIPKTAKIGGSHNAISFLLNENACRPVFL